MEYLLRNSLKSKAHLWDGKDTYCHMFSTGGLVKNKYQVFLKTFNQPICTMCMNVKRRQYETSKWESES